MINCCYAPVASPQPVQSAVLQSTTAHLALPYRNRIVMVSATDIVWLEGASNYTFVHTRDNRRYLIAKNLKRLETDLAGSSFFRVHKSTLVNLTYLSDVNFGDDPHLRLRGGRAIPISRRRVAATRRQIRSQQNVLAN